MFCLIYFVLLTVVICVDVYRLTLVWLTRSFQCENLFMNESAMILSAIENRVRAGLV